MTTIIFLEDSLPIPGVYDATERLVNFHTHAVQARFQAELEAKLTVFKPVKLTEVLEGFWPLAEYEAELGRLEKSHAVWSIRDDRVLLFLGEFAGLVKEARLLWVDLERSRTEFEKELQGRNREAFQKFGGPKLHLTANNPALALRFAGGEDVVEEPKKKTKEE